VVEIGGAAWQQSVNHFCQYLPGNVSDWILLYERRFHAAIIDALLARLSSVALDLRGEESEILAAEQKLRDGDTAGVITFLIPDASIPFSDAANLALRRFDGWPQSRTKLCFDVADYNFADLFAESEGALTRRCCEFRELVSGISSLTYSAPDNVSSCTLSPGSEWIVYSGIQPFDYILPGGEVGCSPSSVDGALLVDGWIVGSIPFGQKYGRIRAGDLLIHLKNGWIVDIEGANSRLCRDLDALFTHIPNINHIGEIGVGQSVGAARAAQYHSVGYQWHERHLGLHLGLGAELPETSALELRHTDYHLDVVLAKGSLVAPDGTSILVW
jgi:hypothetical protein